MTPRSTLAASVVLAAAVASVASHAASPAPGATSTIYQQRGADGRIVLTDRPSPLDTTERSWQSEREDPVAAKQRADALARRTAAVSQQVQRSIDRERAERERLDAEARARAQDAQRDAALARRDDDGADGVVGYGAYRGALLLAPYGFGRHGGFVQRPGFGRDVAPRDRPRLHPERTPRGENRTQGRAPRVGRVGATPGVRSSEPSEPTGRR